MKKHLNEVHYAALGADIDNKKVVKTEELSSDTTAPETEEKTETEK